MGKSKVGSCYVTMASIEIKGKDFGKVADYSGKATAIATEIGDVKVAGAAADVLVDMAIAQGDTVAALNNAKAEGNALVKLGEILLKGGAFEKAGKVAEMSLGIFYGINDTEGMQKGKALMDGAKHAKVCQEISNTVAAMEDYTHVPTKLIVDPGLNTRIQTKYLEAVKSK